MKSWRDSGRYPMWQWNFNPCLLTCPPFCLVSPRAAHLIQVWKAYYIFTPLFPKGVNRVSNSLRVSLKPVGEGALMWCWRVTLIKGRERIGEDRPPGSHSCTKHSYLIPHHPRILRDQNPLLPNCCNVCLMLIWDTLKKVSAAFPPEHVVRGG